MSRVMKDSGIPWMPVIPSGWGVEKGKNILNLQKRPVRDTDEVVTCFRDGEVVLRSERRTDGFTMSDKEIGYQGINKGDIVIHGMDGFAGSMGVSKSTGKGSPVLVVCTPKYDAVPQYIIYYLRVLAQMNVFVALATGIRERSCDLRWNKIAALQFIMPSAREQQCIAEFLDRKCGEIDEAIALQEEFIEELKAYKQSVITEAVTHGLNPNVKFKDSGSDWIGKIPQGWDVIKVGFLFDNLDYLRQPISAELRERNNPQYDYYGASGVIDKIDHYNVDDKVLLIGEDGANLVLRNLPLIYKAEGRFWVNNHAHILKPKDNNDYNYMAHALEATNYRNYITGSAQPKLSQDNLQAVKLPVPPLTEQRQIADYLDIKCHEIDSLIAIKQQKIEELKDYKKSIIYEYVTGKKECIF